MKSLRGTSCIAAWVLRERNATERIPSVSAGSTRKASPPEPDGGNQRNLTAKTRIRISPAGSSEGGSALR